MRVTAACHHTVSRVGSATGALYPAAALGNETGGTVTSCDVLLYSACKTLPGAAACQSSTKGPEFELGFQLALQGKSAPR